VWHGVLCALLSAALFGATAPIAKLLLPDAGPLSLGGLLYLGGGVGLVLVGLTRRPAPENQPPREAALQRSDLPTLAAMIIAGGVVGPALMLAGLARLSGMAGALLLNLEVPFTILLAVLAFGEHLGPLEAAGAALVVAGAGALGLRPGEVAGEAQGVLLISAACLSWALDNNLAARLTVRDPVAVARAKTLGAGATLLVLAAATGAKLPPLSVVGAALVVGALGYGASLVLAYRATRALGAARQAAYFASAPFIGATLAVPLLGERPALVDALAATAMLAGVALLAHARHTHAHTHDSVEHEHSHIHDEHHSHPHESPLSNPHSHRHRHDSITHDHPHVSDSHHRHRH